MNPQNFGIMDPDQQKYGDPRIRIQVTKYHPKTAKKTKFTLKTKNRTIKKRDYKKISDLLMVKGTVKEK